MERAFLNHDGHMEKAKHLRLLLAVTLLLVLSAMAMLTIAAWTREKGKMVLGSSSRIVFFGDSLTQGFGLDHNEAYPALIQLRIIDQGLPYRVVNAGISGNTTANGLQRIEHQLTEPVSIFVLALGTNDEFRGIPASVAEDNLQRIIDSVRRESPDVELVIVGVDLGHLVHPPRNAEFQRVFERLSSRNNALFIPNLLKDVGGKPELNLDAIHPNAQGHKILADNVWLLLAPLLLRNTN